MASERNGGLILFVLLSIRWKPRLFSPFLLVNECPWILLVGPLQRMVSTQLKRHIWLVSLAILMNFTKLGFNCGA